MVRQLPVLLLALLLTASAACRAQPAAPAATGETEVYSYRTPSRDGIGKFYLGREIAQVMGYQGLS